MTATLRNGAITLRYQLCTISTQNAYRLQSTTAASSRLLNYSLQTVCTQYRQYLIYCENFDLS